MKNKLYMPTNLPTNREIFDGVGKKELKALLVLTIINLFISLCISTIKFKTFESFIISFLIITIINFFLVKKDNNTGHSSAVYFGYFIRYFTKQNKYKYKYKGWWKDEER